MLSNTPKGVPVYTIYLPPFIMAGYHIRLLTEYFFACFMFYGNCQTNLRQLPNNCTAVAKQLYGNCQTIVRQLSNNVIFTLLLSIYFQNMAL